MQIRRRKCQDLREVNDLFNYCYPTYGASFEVYQDIIDRKNPGRYNENFVGLLDNRIIARLDINSLGNSPGAADFFVTFIVHPNYRGRGYGRELYQLAECHLGYLNWREVYSWCNADDSNIVAWLQRLGYNEAGRAIESVLDLTAYRKPDDYEKALKRASGQIITIKAFGEIDDPNKERKLWELNEATNADVPDPQPHEKRNFEEWRKKMSAPNCLLDTVHVAIDGDKFVAHTKLYYNYGPGEHAITGATGTLASHRNQGIARALKYRMIDWAVANGVPSISTDNAEQNDYILRINRRLGFKPKATWFDLVKKKKEE